MNKATDWNHYYHKPKGFTGITRAITQNKIIKCLKPYFQNQTFSVCEFGGANSCVVEKLCSEFSISNYHVVDSNKYGMSLLNELSPKTNLTSEVGDVLISDTKHRNKFDLVFSIGLVEHFNKLGTHKAIETHINACKSRGIVLITFPTPTVLYRSIRFLAEKNGLWDFPDERPLSFTEVNYVFSKNVSNLHQSINWMIGLTQGYKIVRKLG